MSSYSENRATPLRQQSRNVSEKTANSAVGSSSGTAKKRGRTEDIQASAQNDQWRLLPVITALRNKHDIKYLKQLRKMNPTGQQPQ